MSVTQTTTRDRGQVRQLIRIGLWLGLLALELTFLSLRHDAWTLTPEQVGPLHGLLQYSGRLLRVLIVAGGVASLLVLVRGRAGGSGLDGAVDLSGRIAENRRSSHLVRLVAHLVVFGLLVLLTDRVFAQTGAVDRLHRDATIGAWLVSFLGCLATWVWLRFEVSSWARLGRQLMGPVATGLLVGVFALLVGQSTGDLWRPFHKATVELASWILRLLGVVVVSDPERNVLGTPRFRVQISRACSGYEGIGLVLAFMTAYLILFRRGLRFPAALLLIPVGVLAIWLANVGRIVLLILIGDQGWPDVAVGGFHSNAGWLAFLGIALGLVLVSRGVPYFQREREQNEDSVPGAENPSAAYLLPLLAIFGTTMLTGLISPGPGDTYYPLRVVAAAVPLWWYRREYKACGLGSFWSMPACGAGVVVFVLWIGLDALLPLAGASATPAPTALRNGSTLAAAGWIGFRLAGSVLTVPLAEELAFRGFAMRRLRSAEFWAVDPRSGGWGAIIVSSLLFGSLHQRFVAGAVAGIIYALVYRREGRLGEAVFAHGLTNAMLAAWTLGTGNWALWS